MFRIELIRPLPELLRDHARLRGDKPAFRDRRRTLTYGELEERTGRFAGHLAGLRLQPGDRALIYLGNCVETIESYLAIIRAAGVAVPLNPHSADAELAYVLDDSGARVVVTDPAHLDQVRSMLPERPHLRVVVTGGDPLPWDAGQNVVSHQDLLASPAPAPARDDQALDDSAWMLYTSGTTGKPKGVLSSQRSCLWSVAACYSPIVGLSEDDHVLWPLPLHHSLAHVLCVIGVTAVGATARILDGFSPGEVLEAMREEPFTFLTGVPAMYHRLVAAAREDGGDVPAGSLQRALTAGSVCPAALRRDFEETFNVPLLDGYGSTETCGLMTVNWPEGTRIDGSCGLPVPGLSLRLVDPDSRQDVPTGQEGEVWVQGPNLMSGYHNQPEATAEALPGGWYRTGDLARRDEYGYLSITGRVKELIIRSGENIHPAEVESVLLQVPSVADAAVVGRPHDVLGEVPVAFVVPAEDGLDPEALYAACREQLANFKVPEEIYETGDIPRTSSGKITRHVLLERPARLRAAGGSRHEALLHTDWTPLPSIQATTGTDRPATTRWALIGPDPYGLTTALTGHAHDITRHPDPAALLDAVAAGAPAPETILLPVPDDADPAGHLAATADAELARLRRTVQTCAQAPALADSSICVVTRGAVATGAAEPTADLVHAPLGGLLRAQQNAHPGRITHVDIDHHDDSLALVPHAVTLDEPQTAARSGVALVPRLARVPAGGDRDDVLRPDPEGTVAVAGEPDATAAALTRHLVAAYGLRHVLLASPRGEGDDATAALAREVSGLGARTTVTACDPADRTALAAALEQAHRPLTAVLHCAAPTRSAAPAALAEPAEARRQFAPAAEAAVNLHQLTKRAGLAAFVTIALHDGVLGTPGHDEQAAAHAFFDALAHHRRRRGLPALCLAAGPATRPHELTAMFDVAVPSGHTHALVMRPGDIGPEEHGTTAAVPPLLRGLLDTTPLTAVDENELNALRQQLRDMTPDEQTGRLVELIRTEMAAVLGRTGAERAAAARTFREIGLTSVSAVQLSNRLGSATGLRLPAPIAFDHPTPEALARYLRSELLDERPESGPAFHATGTAADGRHDAERPPHDPGEPVAVVGMACRYPGGIGSPEDLWRLVADGAEVTSDFPTDRSWNFRRLFDGSARDRDGTSDTRQGGFLYDAADFDAGFFGISPREALAMDPQQRLLLETSWEAIEQARLDPATLRGSRTGVFTGVMYHDYGTGLDRAPEGTEGYWTTGTAGSVASGRVSYTLGFEGPAVTVDTACSSSLVALHWASQALRSGECSLALAGGATVMSTPSTFVEFSRQGGLAADGRCKAFSDAADGTGFSEGVGLLVLERLSDARRNGHNVLAVVRGSAVNQDGASNGLTAPNGPSQQRVIRQALASAGLSVGDVDVVEAHGTGTTLGDPIEAQALLATYGQERERPLLLGSVKSNLGHTQAAAGVAGVIKMVEALRHGELPRTLHVDAPSSHVDWDAGAVELLTERTSWPDVGRARRAAVSSFGVSGTNAHVIIEEAPAPADLGDADPSREDAPAAQVPDVVPVLASAKSAGALDGQIERLGECAAAGPALDVGFSSVVSRSVFEHRAVLLASDEGVTEAARGVASSDPGGLAVVFSGQGSQRLGMGRELYERFPVFAEAFDAVLAHLDPGLRDVVWGGDEELLNRTGWAQPALFAIEVALFRLAASWGIEPDYLAGHSIGEIAAAHVAGVFSLEDACRLVSARAGLMEALPGGGAMVAVEAAEAEVVPLLTEGVSLAAVNGPSSVVVAGVESEVEAVCARLAGEGRKTRRLLVSHAFHSSLMDPMLEGFREAVAGLSFGEPVIPVVSNVTGRLAVGGELASPEYWVRHVRETVRFGDSVGWLAQQDVSGFVELGPDGVLSAMAGAIAPDATAVPFLRKGRGEEAAVLGALGRLHVNGVPVEWQRLFDGTGAERTDLPTYPFQHERYWAEIPAPAESGSHPVDAAFWELVESDDVATLARALGVDAPTASAVSSGLTEWRSRERVRSSTGGWCYREWWKPLTGPTDPTSLSPSSATVDAFGSADTPPVASPSADGAASAAGVWLVVVPAGGGVPVEWASSVVGLLGARAVCLEVEPGLDRAELAARVAGVLPEGAVCGGVLSFLPVAGNSVEDEVRGVGMSWGFVSLVQALGDVGVSGCVWGVTAGAVVAVPGDVVSAPVQSAVWGLGRVAALELPRRWGGLVDLPAGVGGWDEELAACVAGVLAAGDGEDQVAVRASGVYGRRLVPTELGERVGESGGSGESGAGSASGSEGEASSQSSCVGAGWVPSGSVLVTGGTGALGARVARWVVERGAGHVVLTSRRGVDAPGADVLCAELEALGARVTVAACDVGDRDALAAVVEAVPEDLPLTAVVHAAGVGAGDGPVESLEPGQLAGVLGSKVAGAWHLHELTRDLDLDAFVLFGSGAASWGSGGQPAYAAANAFLDGLAQFRRGRGLPATSLAWGAWGGGSGLAADEVMAGHLERRGLVPMEPELALWVLGEAVSEGRSLLTVTNTDWELFAPSFTAERSSPLLSEIPQVRRALAGPEDGAGEGGGESGLRARLAGLSEAERSRELLELVRTHAAAALGHSGPAAISVDKTFRDQGFDSLTAVELRNRLVRAVGMPMPSGVVFDHPTPRGVADYLTARLVSAVASGNGEARTASSVLGELQRFESSLWSVSEGDPEYKAVQERLDEIVARLRKGAPSTSGPSEADIEAASVDQLLDIIDDELLDLP